MTTPFLKLVAAAGIAIASATGSASIAAAEYPEKPIRIIVPYAPGGGTDTQARRLAAQLGPRVGAEVVVENIGGAGGSIGMKSAADADPDGYSLVFALSSQFAINVSLFDSIPYDPVADFSPISLIGSVPYVLAVHPSLAVDSLQGLIDYAKEHPGELSYASAGVGSGAHLTTELLKSAVGIEMVHIPYKGAGAAYPDLLSGRVQVMFATFAPIEGYIKEGRLIPIAVSGGTRAEALPDLPSVAETIEGFDATIWYAFAAPDGTPDDIIATLNAATLAALAEPEIKQQFADSAITVIGSSPEELAAYIPREIEKWRGVVEASGAKVQ